jgi:hypothetical protein
MDESRCCAERAVCEESFADNGLAFLGDKIECSTAGKVATPLGRCAGFECVPSDQDACCVDPPPSVKLTGFTDALCGSEDDGGIIEQGCSGGIKLFFCEMSIYSKADCSGDTIMTINLAEDACHKLPEGFTQGGPDVCGPNQTWVPPRQEEEIPFVEPAPEIPLERSEPAEVDTFVATFKMELDFELLSANDDMKTELETALCDEFIEKLDVTKTPGCTAEFSAGSVVAVLEITAAEGTSLPEDLPAPSPEDLFAAVLKIDDLDSIKKDDVEFSVSGVETVLFEEGQTTGILVQGSDGVYLMGNATNDSSNGTNSSNKSSFAHLSFLGLFERILCISFGLFAIVN